MAAAGAGVAGVPWSPPRKLTTPATVGTTMAWHPDWHPASDQLAVAYQETPFLMVYNRAGDTLTKIANPAVPPQGASYAVRYSPDGLHLAVGHETSPRISLFKRAGDVYSRVSYPNVLPGSTVYGLSYSDDGQLLALAHASSPRLTIYARSGDTYTKVPEVSPVLPDTGYGVSFLPGSQRLAVAHVGAPYLGIYARSAGNQFTRQAAPAVMPTGTCRSCAYSPDGSLLAVASWGTTKLFMYQISGDTYTSIAIDQIPANAINVAWSPDSQYLAVAHNTGRRLSIYKRGAGDVFTLLEEISPALGGDGRGVAFDPSGLRLAFCFTGGERFNWFRSA